MNPLSVRARLTGLVVLVALVLGVVAATLGVDRVEDQLIADELDASAADQLGPITELFEITEELAGMGLVEEGVFVDDFSVQAELAELSLVLADLVGSPAAYGPLLAAAGVEDGGDMVVLTYFGQVVRFDPVALTLSGPDPIDTIDDVVVPQTVVEELAFAAGAVDLDEVFELDDDEPEGDDEEFEDDELDETLLDGDGLVFGTRVLDNVEYVVFTDASDINRGLDRIRTIVWVSVPLLVLVGGLLAWLLTGRALRPVHAITRRVGEISSGNLHERVPEPATGDEIAELAATMNSMLDRLEVDDRRLRQFVSDASHELRSPVAVLRSEAEVAKRAPEATSVAELADGMLGESIRLQRIVEDLLVLARGEERQVGQRVEVDVDDIVLSEAGRRRSLPVDTSAVSAGRILGTPDGVARVVTHLLDNAARHAAGRVEVGLRTDDGEVRLWVDDDGPGIPVADRQRIFERFARLDHARTRDRGGAGLGLAVVAESVRAMDGEVTVEDAPLGGARFIVRWPATSGGALPDGHP